MTTKPVSLKRREEIEAAAELDRMCRPVGAGGLRPLKPPSMPKESGTPGAGIKPKPKGKTAA